MWYRYDFFKSTLLRKPVPIIDYQFHDNLGLHVAASLMAGTFATSSFSLLAETKTFPDSSSISFSCVLTRGRA